MPLTGNRKNRLTAATATALGGSLLIIALLFGFRGAIHAQLEQWKLIPIPEHFTELYFTSYPRVPQDLAPGKKVAFQFTLHNVEGATVVYPYTVSFRYTSGQSKIIRTGTVTLADNETKTISDSYTFVVNGERGAVVVELTGLHQEIRFLVSDITVQ